ncbi:MAG: hypothetical protein JEY96_10440 [Bacteroidales bacterium]|nr:hypothetical protein [Bacteroidales bacterium]
MRKIPLIALLILSFNAFCQQVDTTIFDSDFEKGIFTKYLNKEEVKPLDFFIAINSSDLNLKIEKKINDFYADPINIKISQYKNKKRIKSIYNSVHGKFLRKYSEETFFGEIFKNGNYNCVSASALFALILEKYHIDYEIKETPTHVYLIADPQNTGYLIETTLPSSGVLQFDEKFKKTYIDYLRDNKVISEQEYKNKTVVQLFNENYTSDETIDIYNLAGLQYYNKGVTAFNNEDYYEALNSFEKAEILYPSDKIRFLTNGVIGNLIEKESANRNYSGELLAKFLNNNQSNQTALMQGQDYFNGISNELIMNHPDLNRYTYYYSQLEKFVSDSIDMKEISNSYYSFIGFYHYSNFEYAKAICALEKAYKLNASNIRTKQFISEVSLKYIVNEGNYETSIDTIQLYLKKFDFLSKDKFLMRFYKYCYAETISSYFMKNQPKKATTYIKALEDLFREPNKSDEEFVELAYGQAATYYFRKSNYNKAEHYILRGLKICPNSEALKQRLESIRNISRSLTGYSGIYSGEQEYKNALAKAKRNKSSTNLNVGKYLIGKWEMKQFREEGQTVQATGDYAFKINLLKSKNVIYTYGEDHHTGTWKYNNDLCILKLDSKDNLGDTQIVISSINNKEMRGFMFFDNDYSEIIEVEFAVNK